MHLRRLLLAASTLSLTLSFSLLAAEEPVATDRLVQLPVLEVTSAKRPGEAQREPQSLTVLTASQLSLYQVDSLADLSLLVPNMNLQSFAPRRLAFPFVRGMGGGQSTPAVTTYIDGVPQLTVNTSAVPYFDLERIEVLRGPQGDLYGRNTIGGAINLITRQPGERPRYRFGSTVGSHGIQEHFLSLSGPVLPGELYYGLSGQFASRDGFTHNELSDREPDNRESGYGRGTLLWRPTAEWQITLTLAGEQAKDGSFVLFSREALLEDPREVSLDYEGESTREFFTPALTIQYFGQAVEFTSITAWQRWEIYETTDSDFSAFDIARRANEEEQEEFTQEFRLASPHDEPLVLGDGLALRWLVGVFAFRGDYRQRAATELRPTAGFFPPFFVGQDVTEVNSEDFGLDFYGQTTLTVNDRLDLTLGARWAYEDREADIASYTLPANGLGPDGFAQPDDDYDAFLPRVGLAYRWTEDFMTYAYAAKGFKAGGFNAKTPTGPNSYGEESSWTYEAGVKSAWLERRLTANLALFYIDWDDLQLDVFDPVHPNNFYLDNVGQARSLGMELELRAKLNSWLELFGGYGLTEAEFREYSDPVAGDVSGNELPFAPDYTWNLGLAASHAVNRDLTLLGHVGLSVVGSYAYDAANTTYQDSYEVLGASVGWRYRNWEVAFWLRNALEEEYLPVAVQIAPGTFVGESSPPRTYGLSVTATF